MIRCLVLLASLAVAGEPADRRLGAAVLAEVEVKRDFSAGLAWKGEQPGYASFGFFDAYWIRSSEDATKLLAKGQYLCVFRAPSAAGAGPKAATVFTVERVRVQSEAASGPATKPAADLDELAHRNAVQLDLREKGRPDAKPAFLKCLGLPPDRAPDLALLHQAFGGRLLLR